MATLISVHNSDGCVGRCDAKCYDAAEPECTCCCGGRNHGVGQKRALENTAELFEAIRAEYEAKNPGRRLELEPVQLQMM